MASIARVFALKARAKLNLCLDVGPKVGGSLHAIRSVAGDLLLADEIRFVPSQGHFSVSCNDRSIAEQDNLVWRAAAALGVPLPAWCLDVIKHIPARAGLGGGSADAAAALRGLRTVLAEAGVNVDASALTLAAQRTGSDVAACLVSGFKAVAGTGEVVAPLEAGPPPWGLLLLKPAIGIATAAAYDVLDRTRDSAAPDWSSKAATRVDAMTAAIVQQDFLRACATLHNDFQAPVQAAYPSVADARQRLLSAGAEAALLCGSGSCVAGFFETVDRAERALARIERVAGDWAVTTAFVRDE